MDAGTTAIQHWPSPSGNILQQHRQQQAAAQQHEYMLLVRSSTQQRHHLQRQLQQQLHPSTAPAVTSQLLLRKGLFGTMTPGVGCWARFHGSS